MTEQKTYWVIQDSLGIYYSGDIFFRFTSDINLAICYKTMGYAKKIAKLNLIKNAKIVKVTRTTKEI